SGCIINTSSTIGLGSNLLGQSNYGAAKEGIIGFTRNIAREMGPYGVRCNAIRPAAGTRLNMTGDVGRAMSKESIERLQNTRPEDVAPLVVWLASDAAANVNGRTLFVSTGRIALYSEPEEERQWVKAGSWTIDEIFKFMPATVARGLTNPTPPQTPGG
ncbi:MAG: SDR family oxidoreductase, partial [Chloroflexi bacterium]|nr:SDR family oxidoreductase [Chloroflexota bacterium]